MQSDVVCDVCSKRFAVTRLKRQRLKNGIEEVYFKCPECKQHYTAYYTNKEIRDNQSEIRRLRKKLNKKTRIMHELTDTEIQEVTTKCDKYINKIDSLTNKNRDIMYDLRKEKEVS